MALRESVCEEAVGRTLRIDEGAIRWYLQQIFYLWRPLLPDPKDDMLLELAVAARCRSIITYNVRDFVGAEKFGVSVLEPGLFLSGVGVLK